MRYLALVVLAACELQPAPKQAPPSQQQQQPQQPAQPQPAPVAVAAADAGVDALAVPQECVAAGVHVADLLIAEAQDPSQKQALQQDRTLIVQRTSQTCAQNRWSGEVISCIRGAKVATDLEACERMMPHPSPTPEGSAPAGAGSAAPANAGSAATAEELKHEPARPQAKGDAKKADAKKASEPKKGDAKKADAKKADKAKKPAGGAGSAAPAK